MHNPLTASTRKCMLACKCYRYIRLFKVGQIYINVNKKHLVFQQTCNTNLNRLKTELKERRKNLLAS